MPNYLVKVLVTESRSADGSERVSESHVRYGPEDWPYCVKQYGAKFRKFYSAKFPLVLGNGVDGTLALCRNIYLFSRERGESSALLFFCLYCWELRQQGKIKAEAWGMILGRTWQAGARSSLFLMADIPVETVVTMYKAASPATLMLVPELLKEFNSRPDQMNVWRGVSKEIEHRETGFSWTLNSKWAEWFAYRNAKQDESSAILLSGTVPREGVLAMYGDENEVVVVPGSVTDLRETILPDDDYDGRLHKLWEELTGQGKYDRAGRQ